MTSYRQATRGCRDPSRRLVLRKAAPAMLGAMTGAALVWAVVFGWLRPLEGMSTPSLRLTFALQCIAISVLFTLVLGIEAVAHERLFSDAFDPLAGRDSRRLQINQRFIQNTLEQIVPFAAGLLALSVYCDTGTSMRAVIACSIVWVLGRLVFWLGYHVAPEHRVAGLIGAAQSLIVLLYVGARFGYDIAGSVGAALPILLFLIAEVVILARVRRS